MVLVDLLRSGRLVESLVGQLFSVNNAHLGSENYAVSMSPILSISRGGE